MGVAWQDCFLDFTAPIYSRQADTRAPVFFGTEAGTVADPHPWFSPPESSDKQSLPWPPSTRSAPSSRGTLQTLVYDILPPATAVFSYAIGSRKLSANEQFFCWCSNSSEFVTNNSNKTRRVIYSRQQSFHHTNKTTIVWIKTELSLLFLPRVDTSTLMFTCVLWR